MNIVTYSNMGPRGARLRKDIDGVIRSETCRRGERFLAKGVVKQRCKRITEIDCERRDGVDLPFNMLFKTTKYII